MVFLTILSNFNRYQDKYMYKTLSSEDKKVHNEFFIKKIQDIAEKSKDSCSLGLPFFHTCKGENLRNIFVSRKISPNQCKVFKKDLTYLFYGKPAYRVSGDGSTSRDCGRFPVTFIIQLDDSSVSIEQAFPFDTGAFTNGIFEDVCDTEKNPAKYELGSSLEDIRKFITCFYGTDKNYYCTPNENKDNFKPFSFELQRILRLIQGSSSKRYDNRAYTVELQIANPIMFDSSSIKAILLPADYMGNNDFDSYLYNNNIDAITYTLEQVDPAHMTPHLHALAEEYMKSENIL